MEEELRTYREALENARRSGDYEPLGPLISRLGQAIVSEKAPASGLDLIDQTLDLVEKQGDRISLVRYLGIKGMILSDLNRPEQALDCFSKAAALAEEHHLPSLKSDALANMGLTLAGQKKLSEGLKKLDEAVAVSRELGDRHGVMTTLGAMGKIFLSVADVEGAAKAFDECLKIAREAGDRPAEAGFLNNLGLTYLEISKYEQAAEVFTKALPISTELNDRNLEQHILRHLVRSHFALGRYGVVISYARQGLHLRPEGGAFEDEIFLFEMLARALLLEKRYQESVDEARTALETARKNNVTKPQSRLWGYVAEGYKGLDQSDDALDAYQKAMAFSREPLVRYEYLARCVEVLSDASRYEEASAILRRSLDDEQLAGDQETRLKIEATLGELYYELQDLEAAIRAYEAALPLSRQLHRPALEARILGRLGAAHADKGDLKKAMEHIDGALPLAREAGDPKSLGELLCVRALNLLDLDRPEDAYESGLDAIAAFEMTQDKAMLNSAQELLGEIRALLKNKQERKP